ncbi:MAG: nucleotide exchange factor GrpE [Lentilitoribacter sp.]
MSQEKPDENLEHNDVDNDLNDILDALNNAEEKIADIPADYDVGEDDEHPSDHEVLEKLLIENETLKQDVLRAAADMQNLRKRTQREIADAKTFSVSNFARDMLGVSDNLRRTVEAAPKQDDENLKTLLEGVEMTERSMLSALERHGVKKLEVLQKKFDPNFHQAMFEVPDKETPNNTVVQVVQDGYIIGSRVLRPAMVGVAKGGPKIVEAEQSSDDE